LIAFTWCKKHPKRPYQAFKLKIEVSAGGKAYVRLSL
jgi:hypothetical protein